MEIKRVNRSTSLLNNEQQHQERKRYEPQLQYLKNPSSIKREIPTKEEVQKMLKEINAFLKVQETTIEYEFHEKLDEYFVKVVDSQTKEVIREIPSTKLLDLHAYIKEKLGLIIDKKA